MGLFSRKDKTKGSVARGDIVYDRDSDSPIIEFGSEEYLKPGVSTQEVVPATEENRGTTKPEVNKKPKPEVNKKSKSEVIEKPKPEVNKKPKPETIPSIKDDWSTTSEVISSDTSRQKSKSSKPGVSNSNTESVEIISNIKDDWDTTIPDTDPEPDDWDADFDFGDMNLASEYKPETTWESVSLDIDNVSDDVDFGSTDLIEAEENYETSEINKKVKPLVNDAIQYHQDKMKLEVKEILDDEVGYRLSRYEKRRRRRDIKDKASLIIKGVLIFVLAVVILGNTQIRTRCAIVFRDFGDLFTNIVSGEETSSNKLVDDILGKVGSDVDTENTVKTNGYNRESEENDNASQ